MNDITCCDVLDKVLETPAGPVNVIKNRETEELFLAFFIEHNHDYPEFHAEVDVLLHLNTTQNILKLLSITKPDESRNLPMALITEYPEQLCLAPIMANPDVTITKYDAGVLLFGLANGIRECDAHGICVLELSPSMVYLSSGFIAKLAFPGVKAFVDRQRETSEELNVQYYVPPELWRNEPVIRQSCLYSYGMMMFILLSTEILFQKSHAGTSFKENILAGVRPIVPSRISPMARTIIVRCWGEDPDDRPSASEIMKTMMKNVEFFFSVSHMEAKKLLEYQRGVVDHAIGQDAPARAIGPGPHQRPMSPRPNIPRSPTATILAGRNPPPNPKMPAMSRSASDMKLAQIEYVPIVPGLKEKGRAYAQTIAKFQRFLMQIREANKTETIRVLLQITPKDDPALIARNLFIAAQCLYMELRTLAKLVDAYVKAAGKKNKFGLLKQEMLRLTYESLICGEPFPKDVPRTALLLHCMEEKVFQPAEIVAFVKNFYEERSKTRKKALCLMFAWFAPEIEELDPGLYQKLFTVCKQVASFPNVHFAYSHFIKYLQSFKEDNWQRLRARRVDDPEKRISVGYILRHDDAANLKRAMDQVNFLTRRLVADIHCPCIFLHERPSLLMYAAAYQAINCFQYLEMAKGNGWPQKDDRYRNLFHFAIAGGNLTIVRFAQNETDSLDGGLQFAAACHTTSIFAHLFKSVSSDLDTPDKFGKKVITTAAAMNNISITLFCLSRKVSVSSHETFGVSFCLIGQLFIALLNVACLM